MLSGKKTFNFCILGVCFGTRGVLGPSWGSVLGPTAFPVCIDDSDCVKLGKGDKFACFQVRNFCFIPTYVIWDSHFLKSNASFGDVIIPRF